MGTGGIAVTSVSFSVPISSYTILKHVRAPELFIVLTPKDKPESEITLPTFYIDNRPISNGVVNITACDRLAFADGMTITAHDVEGYDKIHPATVVSIIAQKLLVSAVDVQEGILNVLSEYTASALVGETYSSVLNDIAGVLQGFWCINNNNVLVFRAWYGNVDPLSHVINDCTLPDIGDTLTVTDFVLTDSQGNEYTYTDGEGGLILQADGGALVTGKGAAELIGRNNCGRTYTYGSVSKALIDWVPELNTLIYAANTYLVVNSINAVISSAGIMASLSANSVGGNEIGTALGEITRKLKQSLLYGVKDGSNTIYTRYQGAIQVDSDEYEKYKKSQGGSG